MSKHRSLTPKHVNQLEKTDNDDNKEVFTLNSSNSKRLYSCLDVGSKQNHFLLDCGATINLLAAAFVLQQCDQLQ